MGLKYKNLMQVSRKSTPRFQDFKIYFPQKTQNTNEYTVSHRQSKYNQSFSNTANNTDNT